MAARPVHPYLDVDGPIAMAHRGFSLDGLENTMTAFAAAVELGMTHVETDVHVTRDDVVVAFHDAELDRVTDGHGRLAEHRWSQLVRLRVGGREHVPSLAELLHTWPDLRVNIDVKDWSAVTPVADVITRAGALHRVCVASFDDRRTAAVRRLLGSGLATAAGPLGVARWRLSSLLPHPAAVRWAGRTAAGSIAFQVPGTAGPLPVVTERSVRLAHHLGRQVHVWTVNDPLEMARLLDLGADGIITDRADLLRGVMRERKPRPA